LTETEEETLKKLVHSRIVAARKVERAKIIWAAKEGLRIPEIALKLGLHHQTVRMWLKRFNLEGISGLDEDPRPGKTPTYSREQLGEVVAAALTNPQTLGLPVACWTLERLEAYLNEIKAIAIKRSRIDAILVSAGLG
jgi:transposase